MNPIVISQQTARRFVLGKQGLWPGRRWNGKKGTAQTIRACEAVQLDTLNIVAPSQAEVKELLEGWIEAGKMSRVQIEGGRDTMQDLQEYDPSEVLSLTDYYLLITDSYAVSK